MDVRRGRTLGLGAVASLVVSGLGLWSAPAEALPPLIPGPSSTNWQPVAKDGAALQDAGDSATAALDLTSFNNTTAVFFADTEWVYFRVHTKALPAEQAGGYVVQIDTNNSPAGWEHAIVLNDAANTVATYDAPADTAITAGGTLDQSVATNGGTAVISSDGVTGGYVAWTVARSHLTASGITLTAPIRVVVGTTADAGSAALPKGGLLGTSPTDVLGTGNFNALSSGTWADLASDPIDLRPVDTDGDGVVDATDNCPNVANPSQVDDDADGRGNACDATPRGDDPDGDGIGALDDKCPEQPGALSNGCPAQSTTTLTMRYVARTNRFKGTARADYDQCLPRRTVTVFRIISGPDREVGTVKTDTAGRYALPRLARRPKAGRYYARVDSKWTIGARCFADKSPAVTIR